jgi:tetratricopeptide (TPR) repeat protein
MSVVPSPSRIEELVRGRRKDLARRSIRSFVAGHRYSTSAVVQACDWYRRLGFFKEGFRLVAPEKFTRQMADTRTDTGKKLLWAANFLNLMGASEFALTWVKELQAESASDLRVIANILLANFEYDRARLAFERSVALESDPDSYPVRLVRLGLADSIAGQGEYELARKIAEALLEKTHEPLLRGILFSAIGEFFAREGKTAEAHQCLTLAMPFFPDEDDSPDRGFLLKWLAYVEARLGHEAKARALFEEARSILHRPHIRAEAWSDVYRLMNDVGYLSVKEAQQLKAYPGLSPWLTKRIPGAGCFEIGSKLAEIQISLEHDEYRICGRTYLGITKEVKLVALATMAGSWGLNLEKAKMLIWPEEVFAYDSLENRFFQLLRRANSEMKLNLHVEDKLLFLGADDSGRVRVTQQAHSRVTPSFLIKKEPFQAADFKNYYGLSRTQSAEWLIELARRGLVRKTGSASATRYHSLA